MVNPFFPLVSTDFAFVEMGLFWVILATVDRRGSDAAMMPPRVFSIFYWIRSMANEDISLSIFFLSFARI